MGNSADGVDGLDVDRAGRVAMLLEPRPAPRLRLIGIDREGIIAAAARVGDMIDAAAERAPVPTIDDVEGQGRIDRQGRMQAAGQLPGLVAQPGHRLHATRRSAVIGSGAAVAGDGVALAG